MAVQLPVKQLVKVREQRFSIGGRDFSSSAFNASFIETREVPVTKQIADKSVETVQAASVKTRQTRVGDTLNQSVHSIRFLCMLTRGLAVR